MLFCSEADLCADQNADANTTTTIIPGIEFTEVAAPAGILGLVFAKAADGESAFVKHVRPNSPLVDQVREGDIVVAVDDVDTSRFSHADLTNLLIEKQRAPRTLRIVSPGASSDATRIRLEAKFDEVADVRVVDST